MLQGRPELDGINLDDFQIRSNFPTAMPLAVGIEGYSHLNSLSRALIVNKSPLPFMCSDNPVILYNSARSHCRNEGAIGLSSEGLQLFYAISPSSALYLYDEEVYGRATNTEIRKISLDDVLRIAVVHFMWSDECIYLPVDTLEHFVRIVHNCCKPYLPFQRIIFRESRPADEGDGEGTQRSLMHHFRAHAPVETILSFSKPKHRPSSDDSIVSVRRRNKPTFSSSVVGGYRFDEPLHKRPHLRGPALTKAISMIQTALPARSSFRTRDVRA